MPQANYITVVKRVKYVFLIWMYFIKYLFSSDKYQAISAAILGGHGSFQSTHARGDMTSNYRVGAGGKGFKSC